MSTLSRSIGISLEYQYRVFEILRLYKGYIFNYFTNGHGGNPEVLQEQL